jgi:acetyl esterase
MLAGAFVVDNAFRGLARLGRLHPKSDPVRHGVEVLRDIAYQPTGSAAHTLDVYRPADRREPLPVVLYVHGGGFRILSKDTHWLMGLAFARRGYIVFNINYRLAPAHPYPAALEDASAALLWVHAHAARFGGDPARLVLAGESAGANLVTSLAIAAAWRREEPFARAVYDADIRPRAVVPACGLLQVSDCDRFRRRRRLPPYILDRLEEVSESYLGGRCTDVHLADPLVFLENAPVAGRPLAPFFTFVGTRDPVLDDTRRLHKALTRLGTPCEVRYFPGEVHAFHAFLWRPAALQCWRESLEWLSRTLAPAVAPGATST